MDETLITFDTVKNIIKPRKQDTHKGSYGALKLICGSRNMTGAAALASEAALRTGVGLLYVSTDAYVRRILQTKLTEPVFCDIKTVTGKETAVLVGCGLSMRRALLVKYAISLGLPTVIDADALTYLGAHGNILQRAKSPLILTPHPAEMSRLCGLSVAQIQADRVGTARKYAVENCVTLVLKGHKTVVALPDGRVYVNTTGNAGLAKGGSGDVLAGIIASLLAQGYTAEESAVAGVWLHGKAADVLKDEISEYGLLASDIPTQVAKLLKDFNSPL
ncbi:MAG: NAD(P)H-hydrate dehydratase [Eubacteriales bacterium]